MVLTAEAWVQSHIDPLTIFGQSGELLSRYSGFAGPATIPPLVHVHLSAKAGTIGRGNLFHSTVTANFPLKHQS